MLNQRYLLSIGVGLATLLLAICSAHRSLEPPTPNVFVNVSASSAFQKYYSPARERRKPPIDWIANSGEEG